MTSTVPVPSAIESADLPLQVVDRGDGAATRAGSAWLQRRWLPLFALVLGAIAGGAVWLGRPQVAASTVEQGGTEQTASGARHVVALGRLTPSGDLRTLAAPFGAGDARVAAVLVKEGQQVLAGTPLAVFDSAPALEAALAVAEHQLASRMAALAQAERAVSSSQAESTAAVARADVAARTAEVEYQRWAALVDQGFVSQAAADQRKAQRDEAVQEQRRARAGLARHAGQGSDQPDLLVARRAVDAAAAERDRAAKDLARALLRAPSDGTVIAVHAQPGERPGNAGVLDLGDTRVMTAEVELYQADVAKVAVGQPVTLHSPALGAALTGHVSRIGLSVGRQRLTDTSPGANVDARVVLATVVLDDASSAHARHLVGLEVRAHIETSTR